MTTYCLKKNQSMSTFLAISFQILKELLRVLEEMQDIYYPLLYH